MGICQLGTKLGKANYYDAQRANKVLKKLMFCTIILYFWRSEPPFKLIIHSDESYANLEDESSKSGMFNFLKGKNNLLAPIFWQSRKIQRLTRSTLAAETLAFTNGAGICLHKTYI